MSCISLRRPDRWTAPLIALLGITGCKDVRTGQAQATESQNERADYVNWLEERSMLHHAGNQAELLDGAGEQWRNPFGEPQPKKVVKAHSVWLLHYPGSVITKPGESVIATLGDPALWDRLQEVGVDLLHTCPTKRAGGIVGRTYTPTIDGWFDRIASEVDPQLGTDEEYRRMVKVARERGAGIAGDLVPLHTGMGPDFRLAQLAHKDYDGIYTIVEIDPKDWSLLPEVTEEWDTALVPTEAAAELKTKGYIPGTIKSADAHPDARTWSGWSATGEVVGADGKKRRWVYLHVFKPAQPALNWSDPSYAARRLTIGDATHSIRHLGDRIVRLDAVPFLGIEPKEDEVATWYYMHPLSVTGTNDLAFAIRKLGGWSFQELNVPMEQYKEFARQGPDLGYDFFTRAQVLSPLLSEDARPLRLAHRMLLDFKIPQGTLIHDLQNHDEITFQLVDLGSRKNPLDLGGEKVTGEQLKERILKEMRARTAGDAAPYNRLYRPEQDGVATTFAGFIAAAIGIRNPYEATAEEVAQIQRAHLLVAHANAMQPGVFALASWDIVGALPIPEDRVADRTADGDYRWINRGGVDLMGANPKASTSAFGLPRAKALYGSLPEQLRSPDSFASQLKRMLAARKQYRIAEGEVIAVPDVENRGVAVLVMTLPSGELAVTALNYRHDKAAVNVNLGKVRGMSANQLRGKTAHDIIADRDVGSVASGGRLTLDLDGHSGRTVVLR